jgi:hypothetical protein
MRCLRRLNLHGRRRRRDFGCRVTRARALAVRRFIFAARLLVFAARRPLSFARGFGARLLLEAAQPLLVPGVVGGQQFQRDLATEPRVLGQIDFAHPALPQRRDDFVVAEKLSGV